MPLSAGEYLGHYEILAPLGAGGMGEVYRARDTRLKRDVALKVLPDAFARDSERLDRFTREAQVLASLNHPNIAQIYDVEDRALVMELVEGTSLHSLIRTEPPAFEEAWKIASQIAAALEYAHDKGIIHRDLKPANIMVTPEGDVKLLDFGLAKALHAGSVAPADPENSPTVTMGVTQVGMILGTAAYMCPEQATGKNVDKRADIWSFGVVFYELLTGERLFKGEDASETLTQVLTKPPDLDKAPAQARKLLRRCLEKDPKKRLRDIGDAWDLVEDTPGPAAAAQSASRMGWLAWGLAGVLAIGLAALAFMFFRASAPPPEQTLRYTIAAPEGSSMDSFAISPDGRYLVIAAAMSGTQQLWLRPMDAVQFQPIPFTEHAIYPFWSPDSRYIGFFAQGKLKKVAASGGPAQSLCDVPSSRGGSWSRNDIIIFSPNNSGISIQRVAAVGGVPVDVTKTKGNQRYPVFLPDGEHFLYLARGTAPEERGIFVSSLDGKENRQVLPDVSSVVFAPASRSDQAGHLLFVRENTLMAAPFDADSAQISGDVFPVADGVSLSTPGSYLPVTVSGNGVLLYVTGGGGAGISQIGLYDRTGKLLGPVSTPGAVFNPSISPNGKLAAFSRLTGAGGADIWVRDLNRGTETRLTSDPSSNVTPFWSPKGDRIVFASNRNGVYNLYQKAAGGSAQEELLLPNSVTDIPSQWSRDGRFIVYYELDPKSQRDLWTLPSEGATADRKPVPFLRSEFDETFGQLSPDGHWMAFTSDRSGHREVYVRPFPAGEGEWTVSLTGGEAPRWCCDGKELFFEAADGKMMRVPIEAVPLKDAVPLKNAEPRARPSFEPGVPAALFDAHMMHDSNSVQFEYDVTADGKHFLIDTAVGPVVASAPLLTVVTNWLAGVKK